MNTDHCSTLMHTALSCVNSLNQASAWPLLHQSSALCLYKRGVLALFSIICCAAKHKASAMFPKDGPFSGLQWISQGTRVPRTNLVHPQLEASKPLAITTWLHSRFQHNTQKKCSKITHYLISNSSLPFPSQPRHGKNNSAVLVVGLSLRWESKIVELPQESHSICEAHTILNVRS